MSEFFCGCGKYLDMSPVISTIFTARCCDLSVPRYLPIHVGNALPRPVGGLILLRFKNFSRTFSSPIIYLESWIKKFSKIDLQAPTWRVLFLFFSKKCFWGFSIFSKTGPWIFLIFCTSLVRTLLQLFLKF